MKERARAALTHPLRRLLQSVGLDIVRAGNAPRTTLLGLNQRPIRTIIDCGANSGQFARYVRQLFPDASLYCFEPLAEPFQSLSAWAEKQQGRVSCFKVALGQDDGTVTMHHHVAHSPSSSLLRTTPQEEARFAKTLRQVGVSVPLAKLDTILGSRLDLMASEILLKLDVQGYEDRVLSGADRVLRKADACVLEVCVFPLYHAQAAFSRLVSLLDEYGFVYRGNLDQSYSEDGQVMWLDAVFVKPS